MLHLINYAPGGTIDSRFDYTYNALGLETTEDTLDGTWTYTYDADGEIIHAVFASNNPASIPNQDLAYNYDAMGNRTSTVINGVTTTYLANNMNEYTASAARHTPMTMTATCFRTGRIPTRTTCSRVDRRDQRFGHDHLHLQLPWASALRQPSAAKPPNT